jgi:hypothetical protein
LTQRHGERAQQPLREQTSLNAPAECLAVEEDMLGKKL